MFSTYMPHYTGAAHWAFVLHQHLTGGAALLILRGTGGGRWAVQKKIKAVEREKKKRKNQTVYFLENTSTVDMTIVTNEWRVRPVLFWIGPDAGLVSLEIQALFFLKK